MSELSELMQKSEMMEYQGVEDFADALVEAIKGEIRLMDKHYCLDFICNSIDKAYKSIKVKGGEV